MRTVAVHEGGQIQAHTWVGRDCLVLASCYSPVKVHSCMRPHSLTSGATTRMRMIPSTPRPSRSNNEKKRRRKNATERLPLQPLNVSEKLPLQPLNVSEKLPLQPLNVSEKLPRNVTEKPRPSKLQLLQNQRVRQTGESLCATWRLAHPGPTPCLPLPTDAHTHTHTHTHVGMTNVDLSSVPQSCALELPPQSPVWSRHSL